VSKEQFWKVLVACLLTSQQRSGPGTAVARFTRATSFPLNYRLCRAQQDLRRFTRNTLANFGGIRFSNRLSDHATQNLELLEHGLWTETMTVLDELHLA
jgi:hypothetical protein